MTYVYLDNGMKLSFREPLAEIIQETGLVLLTSVLGERIAVNTAHIVCAQEGEGK